jgi:hypothetical protein
MNQQISQEMIVVSQISQEVATPVQPNNRPMVQAEGSSVLWLLLLASGILLTLPCIFTLEEARNHWRKWWTNRQAKATVPCKMCHYFISNSYLNCAVHPHQALTVEAADCPDFCPKMPPRTSSHPEYKK